MITDDKHWLPKAFAEPRNPCTAPAAVKRSSLEPTAVNVEHPATCGAGDSVLFKFASVLPVVPYERRAVLSGGVCQYL